VSNLHPKGIENAQHLAECVPILNAMRLLIAAAFKKNPQTPRPSITPIVECVTQPVHTIITMSAIFMLLEAIMVSQ
jgi:hypothetical protein